MASWYKTKQGESVAIVEGIVYVKPYASPGKPKRLEDYVNSCEQLYPPGLMSAFLAAVAVKESGSIDRS